MQDPLQRINFDIKGPEIKKTIFILTGKIGAGKTTFLTELLLRLKEKGLTVSGFLAPRSGNKEIIRSYDIRFADSNELIPLSSGENVKGWTKTGNFYFNPEALKRGNDLLTDPWILIRDLIVVDEIGIFELEGKIWSDAVSQLIANGAGHMILVVRNTLIKKVVIKWDLKDPVIIDIENVSIKDAEKMILARF